MADGKSLWEHVNSDTIHTFPKFSPDGLSLLTTVVLQFNKKCEIQVRNAADGSVIQSSPAKMVAQAVFDKTGEKIFIAESSEANPLGRSTIRCVATKNASPCWSFERPTEASGIALSPDGGRLLTVGMVGHCVVWDWKTKRPVESFGQLSRDPFVVQLSHDGMQLAYGDLTRNALHVRVVSPPTTTLQLLGHRFGFKGARFSDRETVISAGPEGAIRIWNANTGQELRTILMGATCLEVATSPDGKRIATATNKGVILWERASGRAEHQWNDMEESWFVRFAKQGEILVAAGKKGILRLWSTEDGNELHSLRLFNSFKRIPRLGRLHFVWSRMMPYRTWERFEANLDREEPKPELQLLATLKS